MTDEGSEAAPDQKQPVEAWPERCDRRVELLEQRVRHLETLVHRLINGDAPAKLEAGNQDAMG